MNTALQPPAWLIVRLGDDLNWWVEETSAERAPGRHGRGVLDPRQVAFLREALESYRGHGYRPEQFTAAFHFYELQAEVDEGRLRLVANGSAATGAEVFALPVVTGEDGDGAYCALLGVLEAARIRQLNASRQYAVPCTADEMLDELEALDADRYFGGDNLHAFDEINEILEWQPAEWDDSAA